MRLKLYTIRLCRREEYDKLVDFFRNYWGKNHVFCRNKEIFEFQHGTAESGEYDFIVAEHNESHEFHAVLGFISSSQYDGGDKISPIAVSGALWKVRDDVRNAEIGKLGLGVLYYLLKKFPDSAYITLGLSGFSQQIYDALHFDFGLMDHYYIASRDVKDFYIASKPDVDNDSILNDGYEIREISAVPQALEPYYYPTKSNVYIQNRYVRHPFYKYRLMGIYCRNILKTVWVTRIIDIDGHKCIRLVDIVGNMDDVEDITGNVHVFLKEEDAEFIDCYCHGIDASVFRGMGFRAVEGDTVIPNYFEPFEKKNVDIHYAAFSRKPVVIFKGDCDQDRPNLLYD